MDPGNRSSLEELDTAATSVEDSGGSGDAEKLVPHRPRHQLIPQELEALKPVIKTLYIDNGLTFREVQQILHARYNYKPSERQFSDLRRRWNLKKNTRKRDRKKILENLEDDGASEEGQVGTVFLSVEKLRRWRRELGDRTLQQQQHLASQDVEDYTVSSRPLSRRPRPNTSQNMAIIRSKIIRQPVSPKDFQTTEGLMFSINAYISGMYDRRGAWYPPVASQSEDLPSFQTVNKFTGSVVTAAGLLKANSFIEARRLLSSACSLVQEMLIFTHPVTIMYMFLMFFNMVKEGLAPLDDAADLLREYIGKMAMLVLPKMHPWRAICCLFARIDRSQLREMLLLSLKYYSGALENELGLYNHVALLSRVRYIFYGYADDLPGGEIALRKLLAGCPSPSISHSETLTVLGTLTGNLREQGRYEEYEHYSKEYLAIARSYGDGPSVVNGLRITAMAQYRQDKRAQAEANQREAVDMGLANKTAAYNLTWAIEHLLVLESWVRGWERIEDADKMQEEIASLIKRDTKDVEDIVP